MNQGRGGYPNPRGRERGGTRSSTDRRTHESPGGAGSSSRQYNGKYSTFENSGERSRHRKETSSGGKQTSWQKKTDSNKAQPVASGVSQGHDSPLSNIRDRADREVGRAEILGCESEKFDLSLDSKSSVLPGRFWQGNEKSGGQRYSDWQQVWPSAYVASSGQGFSPSFRRDRTGSIQSGKSGRSSDHTSGMSKPIVRGSSDGKSDSTLNTKSVGGSDDSNSCVSESVTDDKPFDICPHKAAVTELNPSLREMKQEERKEASRALEPKERVLRSGMVLLKNYISVPEQVKIVEECQKLGVGVGGFYQPGYRDGAKLNLRMMCLGKNWDPNTSSYGDIRPIDDTIPPPIPSNFLELVKRSIKKSHTVISQEPGFTGRVESTLPWMSPDICIVNFYTESGQLGLHQDRDESKTSLQKGLPVVSISIGDTAEFLYGDHRDVDKAEKVTLESGDVLIFGGESRHVFHGVSSILPGTAPRSLIKGTNLRPGRLNLTFRKY